MLRIVVTLWLLALVPVVRAASLPDVIDRVRPAVVGIGTAYPARQPNRKG